MATKRQLLCTFTVAVCLSTATFAQDDDVDPIPVPSGNYLLFEPFTSKQEFDNRWVLSDAKKDGAEDEIAKYDGEWAIEEAQENGLPGDLGLSLKSKAKHHGVSVRLDRPFEFRNAPFVMQYDIKFQDGQECGGAYVKLLSHSDSLDLEELQDKTPYTIMFGPDKCGDTDKIHFIFRHKNPKTGEFEEKHSKRTAAASFINDHKTHVYTLIISPDNTYEILVDQEVQTSGSLLSDEDFTPPVNPPREIDDPDDSKPSDWDEREKIPDPDATKPDDWDEDAPAKIPDPDATKPDDWNDDEPEYVDDPDASKPSDWDEEEDGEWEAPQIPNPKCQDTGCGPWSPPMINNPAFKGKWRAPMIDNPNYKGKWKPRRIPNPDFFEDQNPFKMTSIGAIGLELWSMSNNILFDNFLVTADCSVASQVAEDSWRKKAAKEGGSITGGMVDSLLDAAQERPWLWGFYALALVLPFVLLAACCCRVKSDEVGEAKKTDEPQPDDPHKDDEEKEEKEEGKEEEKEEESKGEESEGKEQQEEADDKSERREGDENKEDNDEPKDLQDPPSEEKAIEADEEEEVEGEAEEEAPVRKSPRKRKARKET